MVAAIILYVPIAEIAKIYFYLLYRSAKLMIDEKW